MVFLREICENLNLELGGCFAYLINLRAYKNISMDYLKLKNHIKSLRYEWAVQS